MTHTSITASPGLGFRGRDSTRPSAQNMLAFADDLRLRGAGLRVLNLGGGGVDTSTPMESTLFMIMAALAEAEHEIKSERITDSISKRRTASKNLGVDLDVSSTVRSSAPSAS